MLRNHRPWYGGSKFTGLEESARIQSWKHTGVCIIYIKMILDLCAFVGYFAKYHFIKRWRGNYSMKIVAVLVYPCFPITFVLVLYIFCRRDFEPRYQMRNSRSGCHFPVPIRAIPLMQRFDLLGATTSVGSCRLFTTKKNSQSIWGLVLRRF